MDGQNVKIKKIIEILRVESKKYKEPIVTTVSRKRDPYKVLIATILSLRTKDDTTHKASERLFKRASTPYEMVKLPQEEVEKLIYPVGFYKRKAKNLIEVSKILIEKYDGKVPDSIDELLKLPGVGRKTANLVITLGYGKYGICVDTHVHRISNRLGLVKTKTPEETEFALRKLLPKEYWIEYNDLLVTWGQNICTPISPKCSICAISSYCSRVGVKKFR